MAKGHFKNFLSNRKTEFNPDIQQYKYTVSHMLKIKYYRITRIIFKKEVTGKSQDIHILKIKTSNCQV